MPDYLSQAYWWSYLSPLGVWMFDHQPVINAILLGQYRRLVRACIELVDIPNAGTTLQLTAVYGVLTPVLARNLSPDSLHLIDIAPIQLEHVLRKMAGEKHSIRLARMNAECLAYADESFDTILIYFLLHELPAAARRRVIREAARVLKPGGALVIADYAELAAHSLFHRIAPLRWLFERLEPFLAGFWRQDLDRFVTTEAAVIGRTFKKGAHHEALDGFYKVRLYSLAATP